MALSAFDDKSQPPREDTLAATLGAAYPRWCDLRERLAAVCDPYSESWGFTSKSTGWGLRAKKGDRVVVYLTPGVGEFRASFALGERAVQAARGSDLADEILALINDARRYAEGTAVRLAVRSSRDVDAALTLAMIKVAH